MHMIDICAYIYREREMYAHDHAAAAADAARMLLGFCSDAAATRSAGSVLKKTAAGQNCRQKSCMVDQC